MSKQNMYYSNIYILYEAYIYTLSEQLLSKGTQANTKWEILEKNKNMLRD